MPLSTLGSALIGGASSLGSSLLGNIGAARRQKKADERNIEFWRMQNAYNHPAEQMKRLREAGLNPNMIYGTSPTSAVGNAGDISPSKPSPYNIENPLKNITQFADVKQRNAQTNNLETQNTVLRQEALLKAAQTTDAIYKGQRGKLDLGIARELKDTQISAAKANLRSIEEQIIGAKLDNDFKDQSIKDRVKDVFYRVENAKENLKGTRLLNELRTLERDLKQIGIEKNDPWYFRIFGRGALDMIQNPEKYNLRD